MRVNIVRIIGTLGLLAGQLSGQSASKHTLQLSQDNIFFQFPLSGHMRWTGNQLTGCDYCDSKAVLWTVDRNGNRKYVAFEIPGADYTSVTDVAAGPDGSLTAVGTAISGNSRMGTFIARISPDSAHQIITRVWPYAPHLVTVASDGTIWTVGPERNDDYRNVHANVLRHYSPSGQLMARTIVKQDQVRPNSGGVYEVSSISALMASKDRIGWLTDACQYFEFSMEAVQLGRYDCPTGYRQYIDVNGVALSSENQLLVGAKWLSPLSVLELDRTSNTWAPVPVSKDTGITHMLLGFDGLTLVTTAGKTNGSPHMRRYSFSDMRDAGGSQ